MGTNFYITTTDRTFVRKYFPDEYELIDEPDFAYEIHLGKRSGGWKPLFQGHKKAYESVEELRLFLRDNTDKITIKNEYGDVFTADEFDDEFIKWGEQQKIRYMKYVPEGIYDKVFGGKMYLTEGTADDYDITMPYDHLEYEKLDSYNERSMWGSRPFYYKDKDEYDFTDNVFS